MTMAPTELPAVATELLVATAELLPQAKEEKFVEKLTALPQAQKDEFTKVVDGADAEKGLSQDESAALLASLGPEVAKYLQLNVVGDIGKIPVETLRSIAMQAGAGRGEDLSLGIQDNMGIHNVENVSRADLGTLSPVAPAEAVAQKTQEKPRDAGYSLGA